MKRIYNTSLILVIVLVSFALVSCGGGGGSSSNGPAPAPPSTITYEGLTTPATITEANSEDMLLGSLIGVEAGGYFSLTASSKDEQPQGSQGKTISNYPIAIDLPLVLKNSAKNISFDNLKGSSLRGLASTITETIPGNCGGTATYTLNVNDTTGGFDGTYDFSQYCEDGIVISGDTDISGTANLATGDIITVKYEFDNLTVDEFIFRGNIFVNGAVTPQIITLDLLVKDSVSDKVYWAKEYSIVITEINATDMEFEVTGTYYDPDQGYVTVSTPEPLLVSTEDWPILGILLNVGDKNTKAQLTAINAYSYKIEADTDGDDTYDYDSGALLWPGATVLSVHSWTEITSDNKSLEGWTLQTNVGIDGILGNPRWAYGLGVVGEYTQMNTWMAWTPPYPPIYLSGYLSGQPSNYNGYSFGWTWTDSNGSYTQTAVATGVRQVELSYDFNVVSGGEHPTIEWSNDDLNFSEYRIRVLNPDTEALLYQVSLDYAQYGAHPVYQITEFSFLPGVSYSIRIEARQYVKPDIYSTPDGIIPMVLNRSTLLVTYTNS